MSDLLWRWALLHLAGWALVTCVLEAVMIAAVWRNLNAREASDG